MFVGDATHYLSTGLSALRRVESALARVGRTEANRILDLPCGFGRVLRFLVARFPEARVTACDLNRGGVNHCAKVFGATAAHSKSNFDRLSLDETFDLAWCGSLATHLDAATTLSMLRFFERHLDHGGLLVVTTHGAEVLSRLRSGQNNYSLPATLAEKIVREADATGYGYAAYPWRRDCGISVTSHEWMLANLPTGGSWRLVEHVPRGWDNHQDVYALQKM